MNTPSLWKKPLYSALVFFGTIIMLSVGYAALSGGLSTADKVGSGSGLTASAWNKIVDGVLELDTRTANINQAPFISTTNRSTVYLNTNTSTWQYMGTSVTFTVPSGPNRKYRISSRAMAAAPVAWNYMVSTVSNSSSTVSWQPIWMWSIHEYATDGAWHSTFQEGYVDLAPGTYTYYLIVWSATSYLMSYHHDTSYTNIIVWPM